MIEKTLSSSRPWLDKVPSPTGSEDSGLGWSPQGAGDCLFRLENSEKVSGNYFNYSESEGACSPSEQGGYKSWNDFDTNCKPDGNQADFQSYNIDQKPIADVLDSFWDQKPLANSAETKKTGNKANNKKKQATGDNSPSSKLERCFQPKTGNGKPRQTSVKRKPSQKNSTAYPYPGVRVLTVREKLKKMRECKERSQPASPSASCAFANNQPMMQSMPQSQFQQNFNQAVQQQQALQDVYSPMSRQPTTPIHTATSLETTSPLHHISPSYAPSSISFDLDPAEVSDSYPQSLSSSSPTHSSHCSSPQQYPSSPEMSPGSQTFFSSPSQCKEMQLPNYQDSMQQMPNYRNGFGMEQIVNQTSSYEPKFQVQNSFEIEDFGPAYDNSCPTSSPHFNNHSQYNFAYDANGEIFQCVQRGDVQSLRKLLSFKREYVDMRDEAGKFPLFAAIECGQLEVMKLLLGFQANCMMKTFDGRTVFHAAAACQKSDMLLHLLSSMHRKDIFAIINETTSKAGFSALHLAAKGKLINNLMQLLRYGANFLLQDNCGFSPLHIAIQNSDVMSVRALIQFARKSQKTRELTCQRTLELDTPLHLAAKLCNVPENCKQQVDIIKLLIGSNADPCAVNFAGIPPKNVLPPPSTSQQVLEAYYLMGGTGSEASPINMLHHQMVFSHSNLLNGVVCPHSH